MDTLTTIIISGILLVALTIAFVLANRKHWRILKSSPAVEDSATPDSSNAVDHYTKMRDEATLEDAEIEEEEDEEEDDEPTVSLPGGSIIGSIIGLTISTIVGIAIWNNVKQAVTPEMMNTTAIGGASLGNIMDLTPYIIGIPILLLFIITIFGMFSGTSSSSTDEKPKTDRVKKAMRKKGVAHYTDMRDKLSKGDKHGKNGRN